MWKRLNNNNSNSNAKGTHPPAPESIPHGGYVEDEYTAPVVNRTLSPPNHGRAPPRPPRQDVPAELPHLPLEVFPPQQPPQTQSRFRPASSVYSQPSPVQPTSRFPRSSYNNPYENEEDVSPPSSPEFGAVRSQNPDDDGVSPIDETPDMSRLHFGRKPSNKPSPQAKAASSNIPVMRREKRRNQVAAAAQNLVARKQVGGGETKGQGPGGRVAVDPRWDPYSGEITTSDKGKPQSVKPGQFTAPALRSAKPNYGVETSISGPPKPNSSSFGERVRKLKGHTALPEKPEWKGATGRVNLVSPVADRLDVPPLSIPRKSSKRVSSPPPMSESTMPVLTIRSSGVETGTVAAQPPEPTIRTVFTDSGRNSPRVLASPTTLDPNTVPPAAISNHNSQIRGNTPTQVQAHQKKDSVGAIERNFREAFKDVSFNPADDSDPYVQPPSRFSVTTYDPSTAQGTPRASIDDDQPPMPTPPQNSITIQQEPSKQATPILNRKRPKVVESPKVTTRKALNNNPPVVVSMTSSIASKRSSNVAKSLPQSPPEVQSLDLISTLQAQLENLAHRRNNITRSINQMTKLMPQDNITAAPEVRRKREAEKLKVEGLREEEAEIRQQEHELGLKLHRAWKRMDKEATYEPTGLWVRRVTG